MEELQHLFYSHLFFCDKVFKKSTETSCLHHAIEEICEIWKEKEFDNKAEEYADAVMCLLHGMNKAGITLREFTEALKHKLEKNKSREWIENEDGSYTHVKK